MTLPPLAEMRKTLIALIALGAAVAALFWTVNPNWAQAGIALVGAAFAVITVFLSKNHTEADLSKAVAQLQAAALTVVGFFATVPTSTSGKIALILGALIAAYGVWKVPNANPRYVAALPPPGR